jgi:hypothetical protein
MKQPIRQSPLQRQVVYQQQQSNQMSSQPPLQHHIYVQPATQSYPSNNSPVSHQMVNIYDGTIVEQRQIPYVPSPNGTIQQKVFNIIKFIFLLF